METITITRKYVLIPEESPRKEWNKRVQLDLSERIKKNNEWINNSKDAKKKKKYKQNIEKMESDLEAVKSGNITKQIVNNYSYNLVRDCMESEARRKNYILSNAYTTLIDCSSQDLDMKETRKIVNEVIKSGYRVVGSKKGSLFDNTSIECPLGGYGVAFSQQLTSKFWDCVKDGLADGKCSLVTYKMDSPFTVAKDHMTFSSDYDSYEELCEHINDSDLKLYFDFGNNSPTIARFIIDTGRGKNRLELRKTLLKVYSGEYEYCGSSIQMDKANKKIILNLTMKIPKIEKELDENTIVGVDLGIAYPAVCAVNTNNYVRQSIGSADDFNRVRTKIRSQKSRLNANCKYAKGGHGRKKKLKALETYRNYEAHWVQNYNHMVSKQVIDFALKNNAKYIHIENLEGFDCDKKILSTWSYYQLQQYITYKAEKYGIIVKKVNPYHTSQRCSCCGHESQDNRPGKKGGKKQSYFKCVNCGTELNADFNAARNIAMSNDFSTGKHPVEELKKQHFENISKQ